MARDFQRSDEGMTVRTADGDDVGTIETVEGNTARVKPETGVSESIRETLGWGSNEHDIYELPHGQVARFDNDGVHLET